MVARRKQKVVSFRSDFVAERLDMLARDGRSRVAIIEEIIGRAPLPSTDHANASRLEEVDTIIERMSRRVPPIPSMAEFDAAEYDENGHLR